MRERQGRTLPFVVRSEDEGAAIVARRVLPGSTVYADEAAHWDVLHAHYDTKRINYGFAFSDDGACTNQAESFFSRLRRAEFGQHHHISGDYLGFYAGEMAWREDMRRETNGDQYERMTADALHHLAITHIFPHRINGLPASSRSCPSVLSCLKALYVK